MPKRKPSTPDKRTPNQIALAAIRGVTGCSAAEAKERLTTVDVEKLVALDRARKRGEIVLLLYGAPEPVVQDVKQNE